MKTNKLSDVKALNQLQIISNQLIEKEDPSLPKDIAKIRGADFLYRNLKEDLEMEEGFY